MSNIKYKIRKGDEVIVLTGKDKGKSGEITKMMPAEGLAIVQGVNLVKRHQRQTQTNEGGIITKEAPIHISNLALKDPKTGKATKVGFKIEKDGTKTRISKASGEKV
jgi:large subunit ribosomal protein L24